MKRGQAALEFLMTYGWAILVVLAAIAALAYFGVLSPDRFLPEKCTMPSGLACLDFKADNSTGITVIIQNSLGFDINTVTLRLDGCTTTAANASGPSSLTNGETGTYTFACATAQPSGKFRGGLNMSYVRQDTSLSHVKYGELILTIP